MPDVTLPTPGEVEEMRARHAHDGNGDCAACYPHTRGWPCEFARLLALVGNLHEEVFDHWCTPGCDDGCDIAKTRCLTTDTGEGSP